MGGMEGKLSLTRAQKQALVSLVLLSRQSRVAGFKRWDIGQFAKNDCSSYPMGTMRALQRRGFAEPVSDEAVSLVESGQCRCGCDLWRPTKLGDEVVSSMKVVGRTKLPKTPSLKDLQNMLGAGDGPEDAFWKNGEEPPPFDPNSKQQRTDI